VLAPLAAAALIAATSSAALVLWPAPKDPMALTRAAGLKPEVNEHLTFHVHSHLDIFIAGKRVRVPSGIGIDIADPAVKRFPMPDGSTAYGGIARCPRVCISPLHTHDDTGVLHTETSKPVPNRLGQFFTEWNVRLTRTCVATHCKSVAFYVNGHRFRGDPRTILLADLTEIAIVIGPPPKKIPSAFPR
jgi:hypothetical protein